MREDTLGIPIILVGANQDKADESNTHASTTRSTESLAFQLNYLKDKKTRYDSHISLLTRRVQENVIPNGLNIDSEPTIANREEEVLGKWFKELESSSINLMQEVLSFCHNS